MAQDEPICRAVGVAVEGVSHAELCAIVREAFAGHPRAGELTVTLEILSPYDAVGEVLDGAGKVLVERRLTIMDRTLHRSALDDFVRDLARAAV